MSVLTFMLLLSFHQAVYSLELRNSRQVAAEPAAERPFADPTLLVSFAGNSKLRTSTGDIIYRDEDILQYDPRSQLWSMFFDGSDVGIRGDINAFTILPDGAIVFSLEAAAQIADLGLVDDSDLLHFQPVSTGENTDGVISLYFDGSDVGLSTSNEDIHGLHILDNGNLLISTGGNVVVPGQRAGDEDVLEFITTSLGPDTAGTWALLFNGSNAELNRASEDIRALSMDANELHFTTLGAFSAGGVDGRSSDLFTCLLQSSGELTSCDYSLLARGADSEIGSRAIDAFHYFQSNNSVDTTAPVGVLTFTPAANEAGWHNSEVVLDINWSDDGSIDATRCDSQLLITTAGDAIAYTAACSDLSGNTAVLSGTLSVDLQPPETTITETDSTPGTTSISFSGTDDLSDIQHYECSLNDAAYEICVSPVQYEDLGVGSYLFAVRSVDIAGNTDQSADSFSWTINDTSDRVAPIANPTTSPVANTQNWFNTDVEVLFNWFDDQGIDTANCIISTQVSGEGMIDYSGTCSDVNGNIGEHSGTLSIDKTPPSVSITAYPASGTTSDSATLAFSATDNLSGVANFECQLDDNGFSPCNSPVELVNLAQGPHEFLVRATDRADNSNSIPAIVTWTIGDIDPSTESAASASRFLQMASLAATDADIASVINSGKEAWLDNQLAIDEPGSRFDWMIDNGYKLGRSVSRGFDFAVWARLFTANNPVQQRWTLALSEIFVINIDALTGPMGWKGFGGAAYFDMLEKSGTGNYRDLLEEITLSLQMGEYLSLKGSKKRDGTGRAPDENFAREILQLFSIGLHELNTDGTLKLDASGNPIETYTNNDIVELAKALTGWSNNFTTEDVLNGPDHYLRPMVMLDQFHDTTEASFLGTTIPANTSGEQALKLSLDAIANHPNVGPFLARQLIKRLVTSNPSPAYVQRVANVFNADESGARGNLAAVLKSILLDPEAQSSSPVSDDHRGKLREPILRFIQWGRTFGLDDPTGAWIIYSTTSAQSQLGQSPLRSPSVFNFFRPEYIPPNSDLGSLGLTAPELQITNETSVAGYANFMHRKIPSGFSRTVRPDYSTELQLALNPRQLVDRLNLLLAANQLSPETVNLIVDAISAMPSNNSNQLLSRVHAAILMTMLSPDYLVLR